VNLSDWRARQGAAFSELIIAERRFSALGSQELRRLVIDVVAYVDNKEEELDKKTEAA